MVIGTLKRPNPKGFVFVQLDGGGDEIFCHASKLVDVDFSELAGGERVEIEEIVRTPKGRQCVGVRLL